MSAFYTHLAEVDPDLLAQFEEQYEDVTFERHGLSQGLAQCSRCAAVVPSDDLRLEWDGRVTHAAWHKETSAVIYALGSGLRAILPEEPKVNTCPICGGHAVREQHFPVFDMAWEPHYDEEGNRHTHDPNGGGTTYRCANGHAWQHARCAYCDFGAKQWEEPPWDEKPPDPETFVGRP